jgi:gliding motility-associated-like protein
VDFENIQLFLVNSSFIINQRLRFSLNQRELEPEAMALTPDGGVIIIGDASTNTTFRQGFVMRLGAGGVPIWSKTFASDFDVEFSDMVFDENGVIHISGHLFRQNTGFDGLLLRVSGSGELIDARAFHASEDDKFRTLEKSNAEFIVAGDAGGFDDRSMVWMRLNNNFQSKDAHRLNYGSPFTNYVYASEPMNSGAWLLTGEFTAPNVQRDGGFIRTDPSTGGNCFAEAFQFNEESISLVVSDVSVLRTEPERTVEPTNLELVEIPVEENVICSTVPPTAVYSFVASPNCPEVCVQFNDSSFCSINEWNWEFPGATPSFSNEQNPQVCYPGDGFYTATLIVSNEGGSDTLKVDVNLSTGCNLPVPNAFSPNGDGKNDFLVIPGFPPGGELFIYNRWGSEIFKAADYQNNWDGGDSNSGTYYYVIRTKEGKEYSGYVTLIK